MDQRKKTVTEKDKKIKYAVEFTSVLNCYRLVRASFSYKGPGKTFENIQSAVKYRNDKNQELKNYGTKSVY